MSRPNPSTLSEEDVRQADLARLEAGTLPMPVLVRYAREAITHNCAIIAGLQERLEAWRLFCNSENGADVMSGHDKLERLGEL